MWIWERLIDLLMDPDESRRSFSASFLTLLNGEMFLERDFWSKGRGVKPDSSSSEVIVARGAPLWSSSKDVPVEQLSIEQSSEIFDTGFFEHLRMAPSHSLTVGRLAQVQSSIMF